MRHISLFTGIGGFELAAQRVWGEDYEPYFFCEMDEYCQAVLKKHWPEVPIFADVRDIVPFKEDIEDGRMPEIDLLTGGFPCQPFSSAGKRDGRSDNRYLWPEMLRVVRTFKPTWVVAENVRGLLSIEDGVVFEQVCADLENAGYEVQPFVIPAVAVDAHHRRDRFWFVGNCIDKGLEGYAGNVNGRHEPRRHEEEKDRSASSAGVSEDAANAKGIYAQGQQDRQREGEFGGSCRWLPEPDVGRVANGVPCRVDRLKALGNAIVPQVAEQIFQAIRRASDE